MTDATSPNPSKPELNAWLDAWRSSTQEVLSQVTGQPNVFEAVFEPLVAADSDLRYTATTTGAVQGEMAIRLSEASGVRLAGKFLGGPSDTDQGSALEMSGERREALEELLRQIGGLAATTVASIAGGQVQFQLARAEAAWAWNSDYAATIRTRDEAGNEISLEIRISPALAAALAARPEAEALAASSPPSNSGAAAATGTAMPPSPTASVLDPPASGYRRLLDVGLGVRLRFGTRRMLLREVLALSTGLVVELENELNSPVDLLLDGRVIARGEVVIMNGKYGLRVTEVIDSPPGATP